MISYLAIIAFAPKQDKCLSIPEKYSDGFVLWMLRTIARHFFAYLIHFVNRQ
jgi:hypothetical protein